MKYIKEYKDIDWDDFDIEEEDPDNLFEIGDILLPTNNGNITYYDSNDKTFKVYHNYNSSIKVDTIKHTKDISFDSYNHSINIDNYDGYLFTDIRLWPWLKFDGLKKQIKKTIKIMVFFI